MARVGRLEQFISDFAHCLLVPQVVGNQISEEERTILQWKGIQILILIVMFEEIEQDYISQKYFVKLFSTFVFPFLIN